MAEVYINDKGYKLRTLIGLFLVFVLVFGLGLGIYNYQKNIASKKEPKIEIIKPTENQEVSEAQIILEGKTDPGSRVVVADKEVKVDSKGNYAAEVELAEGQNVIKIEVTAKNGKKSITERKVTRLVPAPISAPDVTESQTEKSYNGSLNNSGPENFWLPEASLLAAAGTAWIAARKRLAEAAKK